MARFRKKPVEVEAHRYLGASITPEGDVIFEGDFIPPDGGWQFYGTGELVIQTLEGAMRAQIGDWVIRGVKGEFYPCKPDIFEQTYEPVEA